MATKKKAAKPAKKVTSKKAVKPAAKKAAPAKKPIKKVTLKKGAKPASKKQHVVKKTDSVKAIAKKTAPVSNIKGSNKQIPTKVDIKKHDHSKPEVKAVHTGATVKSEAKKPVQAVKPVKVVMPEIRTKTVRKYEPEFTKSVLDTYQQEQTGPTMRYSDAELAEFKDLIMKKLDAAKKELAYLQGLITRKDEMGGDDTDNRYMTMEDGSMSMEREQLSQMASRQITFIDHLEKALMRIENKTYGICRVTGKLIDKARLKAVPHATLSIEAKQTMNR
ncbi:MAG TPA: TraR/DksA C4-type zinc finger protein [Puia sp.]|nr:TraR/DksA C4-type zinc finger protein [Puia sp.]